MANEGSVSSEIETKWRYDVFLSFRGEDTRHTFTGHLYGALRQQGINTYMDDEKLRAGEQIEPALLKAIEESRISVIVFSEKYADSKWCLDELVKIMKCKKEKNQLVWPIFYKVDPSDVRNQNGSYGEAMAKHERRFGVDSEKVKNWKSTLREIANLSGDHFTEGRYESDFIKKLVGKISNKVFTEDLDPNEHTVGLEYQVEELKSLLEIESRNTTLLLGIHGTGGIGKTTLAKALYCSISKQFDGECFLPDVRQTSKIRLQKMLLSSLLKEKISLKSDVEGTQMIKRRLRLGRFLIVLDDVDHIDQLRDFTGGRDWFGCGSRIIITTRDRHWLLAHEVDKMYEMNVLNDHESLELFCRYAFKRSLPVPNYEDVSKRAICYAKGLPLALKVIGSHLYGKHLDAWKSALDRYEKGNPHQDIQNILRISYESLDSKEKDIFLDIACFFKGQRLEYVKRILDACDFFSEDGITVLVDKSLITIEDDCLGMHDLIQDMGREVVKEEDPKEAGRRSRLWFHKDVLEVLVENTGSDKIEGIMLDPPETQQIYSIRKAFEKMKNLRILIVRNTSFSRGPVYLPNKLKLLDWKSYPSRSLPPDFYPMEITTINLRGSPLVIEHTFQESKISNLLGFWIMEAAGVMAIILSKGGGRFHLKQSIVGVIVLCLINYYIINFLKENNIGNAAAALMPAGLAPKAKRFEHLTYMDVSNCHSITRIPNLSGATNLRELRLDKCEKLVTVDKSIGLLPMLVFLSASECTALQSFVPTIYMPNLEYLSFNFCRRLAHFPDIVGEMNRRLKINMIDTAIKNLPQSIKKLAGLYYLDMTGCRQLQELPTSMFQNLITLKVGGCSQLREPFRRLAQSHSEAKFRTKLETLHFSNADLLDEDLCLVLCSFPTLKDLNVSGNSFAYLPECIEKCTCLISLDVSGCGKLRIIPKLPSSVKRIEARNCNSLTTKTSNMLWSQVENQIQRLEVIMPIREIPELLDHGNKEGIPVLEARGKFPVFALALVFGELDAKAKGPLPVNWRTVALHVFIDGERVRRKHYHNFPLAENHVLLCDLRVLFDEEEWNGLDARVGRDWKNIQVYCETEMPLSWWRIHVYEQETNMEDVRFTSQCLSLEPLVCERSEEEEIGNKMRDLNIGKILQGFLRDTKVLEEQGYYKDKAASVLESKNMLLEALEKMARSEIALGEEKGNSGSIFEDEDNSEGFSLLHGIAEMMIRSDGKHQEQRSEQSGPSNYVQEQESESYEGNA